MFSFHALLFAGAYVEFIPVKLKVVRSLDVKSGHSEKNGRVFAAGVNGPKRRSTEGAARLFLDISDYLLRRTIFDSAARSGLILSTSQTLGLTAEATLCQPFGPRSLSVNCVQQ
jgi:hypothetical protein